MSLSIVGQKVQRRCGFLAILLVVTSAEGCGNNTEQRPAAVDPVASFKTIVDRFQSGLNDFEIVKEDTERGWYRIRPRVANIEYDVKTTDSLVTPYLAVLTCDNSPTESAKYFKSEAEAKATNKFESTDPKFIYNYRFNYAFQDGRWTLRTAEQALGSGALGWHTWGSESPWAETLGQIQTFAH